MVVADPVDRMEGLGHRLGARFCHFGAQTMANFDCVRMVTGHKSEVTHNQSNSSNSTEGTARGLAGHPKNFMSVCEPLWLLKTSTPPKFLLS